MTEFVNIQGSKVRAKKSTHESGEPMIVFLPFRPDILSASCVEELIEIARARIDRDIGIIQICLSSGQTQERELLENMGFLINGIEYCLDVEKLLRQLPGDWESRLQDFEIRAMDYDLDIDSVAAIEKSVHAADLSSRVNFETAEACASMRQYYKRACQGNGVFLLRKHSQVVGFVGLMSDKQRIDAVHISSVAIALQYQRNQLMFPMMILAWKMSRFSHFKKLTGVTTTTRMIQAAKKYSVDEIGVSLYRKY